MKTATKLNKYKVRYYDLPHGVWMEEAFLMDCKNTTEVKNRLKITLPGRIIRHVTMVNI